MKIGVVIVVGVVLYASLAECYGEDPSYGATYGVSKHSESDYHPNERSQSISAASYDHEEDDNEEHDKVHPKLLQYRSIDTDPGFTHSYYYVSPQDLQARLARIRRAPAESSNKDSYDNTYSKFLSENFPTVDHDPHGSKNAQYKQENDEAEAYGADKIYKGSQFPSDEYERIKYLSDQQAKEIKKNPENCKIVVKGEMECQVCHDAKSNSNSESCSYSSTPDNKKYAYHREKSYNSKDDDKKKADGKGNGGGKGKSNGGGGKGNGGKNTQAPTNTKSQGKAHAKAKAYKQKTHENLKAAETRQPRDVVGLDPYLYGGEEEKQDDDSKSYEGYYSHVFPPQEKSSSENFQQQKAADTDKEYEHLPGFDSKRDVDSVLAEFNKKDWSKCKKTTKGDLTCYKCKDKTGANYEECMFISDSTPQKSRVIYEENKRYYEDADADAKGAESVVANAASKDSASDELADTKPKKRVVIKKRKMASVEEADLTPENNDEEAQSDDNQSFKRTISYKANTDGKELPEIQYVKSFSQTN